MSDEEKQAVRSNLIKWVSLGQAMAFLTRDQTDDRVATLVMNMLIYDWDKISEAIWGDD